jgi:hypothetical protein
MDVREIVARLQSQAPLPIDHTTLVDLLEAAEVLRQDDTCISGWIRILSVHAAILVQEETPDRNALVRRMPTIEDAESFVNDRLATYERMWDGCGCKVDYFR